MNYMVIGAGMMGSAVAFDLATYCPGDEVILADLDLERATRAAHTIGPNVRPLRLDVNNDNDLTNALRGTSAAVGAVSYSVNYRMTQAAIEAGVHMCDMGGNDDVVRRQLVLDHDARAHGVTIVPNCGLAPGLINILAMHGSKHFDHLDSIRLRVGGIPQHPRPPLNYQIAFSAEGLLNEYLEKASVIQNGKQTTVDSMTGLEEIHFPEPFGTLEAFYTSGGLSMLAQLLDGKVDSLDYKTIRYKGHCEKFKILLDLGFATNDPLMIGSNVKTTREFFIDLLKRKLDYGDPDVVLARATITGRTGNTSRSLAYEFIDYYDETTQMTAMMRATAFPTSIIAQLLARGIITTRGVVLPEVCVPGDVMIKELAKRKLTISTVVSETGR
jgi:lysine 6-dehydrogenase